jgi:superfamily II DNA or RNA helicase
MIEKRITEPLLETGALALTQRERTELGLPEHSTTITVGLEGETFGAQWSGRSRQLSGDTLTERLQDYGQVGGLLRVSRVGETYRLLLLPPGSVVTPTRLTAPPTVGPVKAAAGSKAARRRATVDRQFHSDDKYDWGSGETRTVGFLTEARKLLGEQLKAAGFDPLDMVELRLQGEELATLDDFEELLAVDVANVDRMPHQAAAARHALSRMRGRAILADEVGLGKTIEAGLAIKELTLRGLAKRVLVLCPAPLREQWREEMNQKFDIPFDVAYHGPEIANQEKLIVSLTLGTRNIEQLTRRPWDIVIVDEAHRAAGARAGKRRELITALTTACRYAFFLTATPVQNDLLELYRLVELLRPGTFKSANAFRREFMIGLDPRKPSDPAALRRLISSAMIRTTRAQAGVDRVVRRAVDVPIQLGARERELYALSTDLLRNVMRSPGDAMRRRSLALRLTASPFSMGTTAFRIAKTHPDERVRNLLDDIGNLAMDITSSARENRALEITRDWMRDHGRVLIFTQHTDTVTGLLRRMGAEGLRARAFHGSMSPSERAATIAAFRSGEAPIMISTDSGAEGQNLQFCNCVLNYDLPWNPMRIEQRIGRVDRLTQPRDEVFVANLYASGTIDQSVYRLLAEKLRMFELLFGQVTTVLGELDDSKSAPFETRVLGALFAEDDTKMERLLAQLGTELADARERASTLIAADSGMSSWMASAFDHRDGLTKAGSRELAPEVSERARIRQRRVQAWVRRVLDALDAQILHDTGEGDGAFLTAQVGEEVADELGGRTLLHLAFDRHGLENHPDAELCAVGSPVFDELLGLLRMRGDMHATVPVIPDDIGPSPLAHAPSTTLVRRRLVPSGTWSGHATFRATVGEQDTTEHIITGEVGSESKVRLPRRPLADGETLPAAFDEPAKIITVFEWQAAGQLDILRNDRTAQVEREQARELDRIRSGYQAQITEAPYDDKDRLRRALSSEERRLSRRPDVRARAKLLALTLDEDDWVVEETWAAPSGAESTLTYEWDLSGPPQVESAASHRPIKVLALCSHAHWVDAAELTRCDSCDSDLCQACGEDAIFAACPICTVSACASCRTATGGLCLQCSAPERAPDLDREFAVGWRLNEGLTFLVGERVAELIWADQADQALIVPDEDMDDVKRIRMRSYAVQNGLPADSGLVLRDRTSRNVHDPERLQIRTSEAVEVQLSVADDRGSSIEPTAISDLPTYGEPVVIAERAAKVVELLEKLRNEVPPPAPPTVAVTHRSRFTDVYLEAERLVEQISVVSDDGTLTIAGERSVRLQWRAESLDDPTLAHAELDGIRVLLARRNDGVLVSTDIDGQTAQWIAVAEGVSAADQLAWFNVLTSLGTPGGRVGRRMDEAQTLVGQFPSPSECELVDRTIEPTAELADIDPTLNCAPADPASLVVLDMPTPAAARSMPTPMPIELSHALIERAERPFSALLRNGFEIQEIWRGHGIAIHQYRTFDGQLLTPVSNGDHEPGTDFGVCRDGHFYRAGAAAECAACHSWACPACDDVDRQATIECSSCTASVCRRCLDAEHPATTVRCVLCDDAACPECGRDPVVSACPLCDRPVCSRCQVHDLCPACAGLASVSDELRRMLPTDLALNGAGVLAGSDANAATVLINRGDTVEHAVIRRDSIVRWVVFGQNEIDSAYRLRLFASAALDTQVVPVVQPPEPDPPITVPHVVAHAGRNFYPAWSVADLNISGQSAGSFIAPDRDLVQLVADEFQRGAHLPIAVAATPSQVEQALADMERPSAIKMALQWYRTGRDTSITDGGILSRTLDGTALREALTPWSGISTAPAWVTGAWDPEPTVSRFAASGAVQAVMVSMATLVALGVRVDNRSEWYEIVASQQAPAATKLARAFGMGDVDDVGACTDPKKIRLSSVSNATNTSLRVHPRAVLKQAAGRSYPRTTACALAAWLPGAQVLAPELGTLSERFRISLMQLVGRTGRRMVLEIGAHVEEMMTVEDGQVWRYAPSLMSGQIDARRTDFITRAITDEGVLDREGHFVADTTHCRYCGGKVCAYCVDGEVACDCCATAICRRCVARPYANLWVCPACAAMRPPTRSEARQHGRLLLTRNMLIGIDSLHVVVVEHRKHHWTRRSDDGQDHMLANPSLSMFFDEQLPGGSTSAGS